MNKDNAINAPINPYGAEFYNNIRYWSQSSAAIIVPYLITKLAPKSIIDVGCGDGTWLKAFHENGVEIINGIDGTYVNHNILQISNEYFITADLNSDVYPTAPLNQYDMALSLEVAEHLKPSSAKPFVDYLCTLSSIVVFSAAIPGQGGTNHLNEQWPEYWADMFISNGYQAYDCLRPQFWNNDNVAWFYKQNTIVYAKETAIINLPGYNSIKSTLTKYPMGYVTSDAFIHLQKSHENFSYQIKNPCLGYLAKSIPSAILRSIKSRWSSMRK